MKATAVILTCILFALSACAASAQDLQRGLRNYQDFVSGKKKLEQMSPEERQEVLAILGKMKNRDLSSKSDECRNLVSRAESAASDLANYSRRLRDCADAQDFGDDCSSEFRRVKNAHSDYEDAASAVSNRCR